MGNPNGPSEKVAAQPKVSLDRVQEFMVFRPSGKTLEKMKQIHDRTKKMRRVEEASRKAEERTLATMEIALGLRAPDEGAKGLSDEEQQTVEETFDEMKKEGSNETDLEAVREATMGSLRVQKFYKIHYDKWKVEYQKICDKDPGFALRMTMHEYLKEKGIQFIKASGKELIRKSNEDFYKQKSGKDKVTETELKDFNQKISSYVKINREKLTAYYSLEPAEQKKLYAAFSGVLVAAGLKVTDAESKKFFEELIGHIEYEYLAISDYESTSDDMCDAAELNLSEEQWQMMRQKALEKNAKGELQEYLQQQKAPLPDFGAAGALPDYNALSESSYKSVTDVAHSSGVNLRPAPGKGNNVFYLDFPTIKDKKFAPLLKVVFPPGVTDINKARFYIEQPWADKDAESKAQPIDKQTTISYSAAEVPLAINMMILDYLLNKGIPLKSSPTESIGPNDMLKDQDMIHMAERLFGFKLSERRMLDEQFTLFKHFLTVLLRDDQKSSLQERIKKARVAIDNDGLIPFIRKALKSEGSVVKTLDELIAEAKLDQQGKKKT